MARLITDEIQVLIMDVIVHPEYQKRGIGKELMKYITNHIGNMKCNQIFVNLMTECSKIGFYEKCGLKKSSTEGAEGMWLEIIKNKRGK
jgi:N-acetylglutamate synthase-like GNAT family acetyltransferase